MVDGGSCIFAIFFKYFHAECGIIKDGHESIFDSLILNACIGIMYNLSKMNSEPSRLQPNINNNHNEY